MRPVVLGSLLIIGAALLGTLVVGQVLTGEAQALGPNAIRSGFDSSTLAANDDSSTGAVSIGFTVNFFGTNHSSVFVNNNGNVTFNAALSTYTPFDLGATTTPIIAPFFADVDTRRGGSSPLTFGTGDVGGRSAFGVTWPGVHCYKTAGGVPLNHFQVLLTDRSDVAAGDFDIEFNYDQIVWEAGTTSSSGGDANCLGGNPARAGFANGSGTFQELAGSGVVSGFLDSNSTTGLVNTSLNSSQLGRHIIPVRGGTPSFPQSSPFTMTKTGDTNDGFCGALDCSLREAIASGDSGDSITVPAGTYTLTLGTELVINKNLTLTGAGSGDTIIQAAATPGTATSRVFNITAGSVAISGVTIRHGKLNGNGAGINNSGTLTVTSSTVGNNVGTEGGGIFNDGGTLTITDSTVTDNSAGTEGGGIFNDGGTLTATDSAVSDNNAGTDGGGIFNEGTLRLTNSTISGNATTGDGGGIFNRNTLTLTNSTVSNNSAATGGGIRNNFGGAADLVNTITANNTLGGDCAGTGFTSLGHNLDGDGTCGLAATGDLSSDDPRLGPLQDNGGPTFTHALLTGSPAIDAGDDSAAPVTDQRGEAWPQGPGSDIGAYEVPNVGPSAQDDSYSVQQDGTLTIADAAGVLANDTDAEGDSLSTVLVSYISNGTLDLNSGGGFTYTPAKNFSGTDSFTYRASDGGGQSNVATVTLTVNPVGAPPPAGPTPVPSMTQWGLIGMAGVFAVLVILAARVAARRRQGHGSAP